MADVSIGFRVRRIVMFLLDPLGLLAWTTRHRGAKEIMDRADESPDPGSRKVAEGAQPLDVGGARVRPLGSRSVAEPAPQVAS